MSSDIHARIIICFKALLQHIQLECLMHCSDCLFIYFRLFISCFFLPLLIYSCQTVNFFAPVDMCVTTNDRTSIIYHLSQPCWCVLSHSCKPGKPTLNHHMSTLRSIPILPHYLVCQKKIQCVPIHSMENAVCQKYQDVVPHPVAFRSTQYASQHGFWLFRPTMRCAAEDVSHRLWMGATTGVLVDGITWSMSHLCAYCTHFVRVAAVRTTSQK